MNASVTPYHWNNRRKMKMDYRKIEQIYKNNLPALSIFLNKKNNVSKKIRYWEIVIGPWFKRFLATALDRWETLNRAFHKYQRPVLCLLDGPKKPPIPACTLEFVRESLDDNWNNMFFGQIADFCQIPVKRINGKTEILSHKPQPPRISRLYLERISELLSARDEVIMSGTYLTRLDEISLNLKLGQIPKQLKFVQCNQAKKQIIRKKELIKLKGPRSKFLEFLEQNIIFHIPSAFLEKFAEIRACIPHFGGFKKPKVIFTSNHSTFNEKFKIFTAEKTSLGSKLVLGQHGGFYGTGAWGSDEKHEIRICNKFISWGWGKGHKKIIPLGIFTNGTRRASPARNGGLLLIQNTVFRYSYNNLSYLNSSSQWLPYFQDQVCFVSMLASVVFKQMKVRLMPGFQYQEEDLRWKAKFPHIKFETSSAKIFHIISSYRLCVVTYQGTPLNELLFFNFPSIAFWNPDMWEIRKSAQPFFKELEEAGILHRDPQSAAGMVNKIWDSVGDWWHAPRTQAARKSFCERFAKDPQGITRKLKTLFTQVAEKP